MARICFITLGDIDTVPTTKRATGMAPELVRRGHRVAIAAWDTPGNRRRFALECPSAEPLWMSRRWTAGEAAEKLRAVRGWRPDLVYSTAFTLRTLAYLRRFYARDAALVTEHCELFSAFRQPWRRWCHRLLERRSLREADGVVCASLYLLNAFERLREASGGRARLMSLPYGYPDYLRPEGRVREPSAPKAIVFMATLWRNYGVLDVVEAAHRLAQRRGDFTVDVLGDGPARAEAEALVRQRGLSDRVAFRGFVAEDELNRWFSQADVFLAPLYDTVQDRARCPSKVYYYLPYQKPIVTCALGDPPELLKQDGFYYAAGDTAAMAVCLERALDTCDGFRFRELRVKEHAWTARADRFETWCREQGWLP